MTDAVAHFAARLRFETDPADVRAAQLRRDAFVLLDVRGDAAWKQGRAVGALHLPGGEIAQRGAEVIPAGRPVVAYCWGPGCNGATKASLELARLGFEVREMLGGFEYWAREGMPVETDDGPVSRSPDPLTAPTGARCDC